MVVQIHSWKTADGTGNQNNLGVTTSTESRASNQPVSERISAGEKLLIPSQATPEKQAAVKAIAQGNYQAAVSKLEAALKSDRNNPEALIYLNNARIGNQKSYTIAVSVPIGSDVNAAQEILRGLLRLKMKLTKLVGLGAFP
jgi:branched-chain amino acid transport system substrate-binding protein